MKKNQVGIWIDHCEALIARVSGKDIAAGVQCIDSGMESHTRFSGGANDDTVEDIRDRKFGNHLNAYYDRVIHAVQDADAIIIMGPGEAKGELKKRLESRNRGDAIVAVTSADKMTENQVFAHARAHFLRPVTR